MIDAARLLKDLQAELGLLETALGAKVAGDEQVRLRLQGEWRQAFDAERTGASFEDWRDDRLTQVAVAWLLACVFVRFCEDNHLIDEAGIAGPGERGQAARAAQQAWFADHPHLSDREYLQSVFQSAAVLPGLGGLLGEGESPLWLVDPPADACTSMITRFRATDEAGDLVHDFTDPGWSTRFLGDLYQDLSEHAKSTYALLQTPEFVEEFILDRTLNPAMKTFGLAATSLIDPTCGSGHFLLGGFSRLWRAWSEAEPGTPERVLAQRALDQVTGVDLNPFAAAIASFRLLVAAVKVSGIKRLADGPDFRIDVAVGDSLLWGARPGQLGGMEAASARADRQFLYRTEHADDLRRIFDRRYAAVVGNPPYIVARDRVLNRQYRARYPLACSGKYSLAAPFVQRFFDLAFTKDLYARSPGYVGLITTNSFMKRQSGKKLVERLIPTWDLTHMIDASGVYLPGHGTPTVILFGRNQVPVLSTIRTVMGVRGEPGTPIDAAKGLVWTCIINQVDEPGSESEFVTVADTDRARFSRHPWSIGGGGAAELKERLDESESRLAGVADAIGISAVTGEDDLYVLGEEGARQRLNVPQGPALVSGGAVRDWRVGDEAAVIWPYDHRFAVIALGKLAGASNLLWVARSAISRRKRFGTPMLQRGLTWWEWQELYVTKLRTPLTIVFADLATHNHFALDRGGKVFNRTAPVIKLSTDATVDDHLGLVGLLNSAVACFWMQQVFQNKGASVDSEGARQTSVAWDNFYALDSTKLRNMPLPDGPPPVDLARTLDALASAGMASRPASVIAASPPTRARLDAARIESERILTEMVAAQEELDWTCLHLYGLTEEPLTVPDRLTAPPLQLGERAFEIILARNMAAGDLETAWFTRHRSTPITEIPAHWPDWYRDLVQRRIDVINSDRDVALVERPEHKRRWAREPWEKLETAALQSWLADRLEDRRLWFEGAGESERAVCRSLAQLADKVVALYPEFLDVARLWKKTVEIDPVAVIAELVAEEHVPAQAAARYKGKGLQKRQVWERTWDLQRIEDRGQPLPDGLDRIPVPPKYAQVDFAKASYWKQRGKLDVPKERFTSVAGAERDTDPTMVLAWAGFDHAELAQAITTLAVDRQSEGWDADRIWPIVVAIAELLPWLDQWHADVDPRWSDSPAGLYRGIAEQLALAGNRRLADAASWTPTAPAKGRKAKGNR